MTAAAALIASQEQAEIWVAAVPGPPPGPPWNWQYGNFGAYLPETPPAPADPRTATFLIGSNLNGVKIYGGFLGRASGGGETMISQRDPYNHRTILAGSLLYASVDPLDYHVVTFDSVGITTRLDGFWIVNARADDTILTDGDRGAGMLIRNANPVISRCLFNHCKALTAGSGIYLKSVPSNSTFWMVNCSFVDVNGDGAGGGLYNNGATVKAVNCRFHTKIANDGAGIYNNGGTLTVTNCTFWRNNCSGGYGAGIYHNGGSLTVVNSIFWENHDKGTSIIDAQITIASGTYDVTHSCIDDGTPGGTIPFGGAANFNIDGNPAFVGATNSDDPAANLRLQITSPCIGRGSCSAIPADQADLNYNGNTTEPTSRDLGEAVRAYLDIEMGAYEVATSCTGDCNLDGVVNIDDLVIVITGWGPCGIPCPGDITPYDSSHPCGYDTVDIDDLVAVITSWGCPDPNPPSPPQSVIDCLTQYSDNMGKLQACIEAMLRGGTP